MTSPPTGEADGGDSVLLLLPPRDVTVDQACLDLVSGERPRERNVLTVTYARTADAFVDAWHEHVGVQPRNLGVVDIAGSMRSVATDTDPGQRSGVRNVAVSVTDPRDTAGILDAIETFLDEWGDEGESVVNFDSVTDLLSHLGEPALVEFLGDLTGLLESRACVGYFHLGKYGHDARTLTALGAVFDSVLELSVDAESWSWTSPLAATDDSGTPREDRDSLPLDRVFEVLKPRRRRLAIHALRQTDRPMEVSEIAEWIAAQESDADEDSPVETRSRIHTGLRHVHLPKLRQSDVISTDSAGETVELRGTAERLEPFLSFTTPEKPHE